MKKFLSAAFRITLPQVVVVLCLSVVKYWISRYASDERLTLPFLFIGMGAFVLFLIALGIQGYLENKGYTLDQWVILSPDRKIRTWIARFIHWGQALPIILLYSFFIYLVTPTSLTLFLAFFAGVVLRNIFEYLARKKHLQSEVTSDGG